MMINLGIAALVFAIWFAILFFEKAFGLSVLLFAVPFLYYVMYMLEKHNKIKNKKAKLLLIPIVLLSSTYFIYNDDFFCMLNSLVIPGLFALMILSALGEKFEINLSLLSKICNLYLTPIGHVFDGLETIKTDLKSKLKISTNGKKGEKIKKVIKGLVVTVPLVFVITMLLASADSIFADIFSNSIFKVFKIFAFDNLSTTVWYAFWISIIGLYLIGLFYFTFVKYEIQDSKDLLANKKIDNFTIKMILISLNVIYLVFCFIQIKSLFLKNTTINYAQYARQGFFQLMIVSLINLVTILVSKKQENNDEIKSNKFINFMCLLMIVFTFIIVISAAVRMNLYESFYGYTLLRLLVYCVLFTESVLFVPTIMYVLDKKIDLPKWYFIIIITVYLIMNFANFDNIIAKRNVDRYFETDDIDIYYLQNETNTDAIEQIIRILENSKDKEIKKAARKHIDNLYFGLKNEGMDFRNFNLSKIFAKKMIEKMKFGDVP